MNIDQMTIGDFKELAKMFNNQKDLTKKELGKHIVVLQRGWIFIGDLFKEGEQYSLENSSIIRVWGTTKGLGEIALNGPTGDTVLDPTPKIFFHELTVVVLIKCEK